jgi:hypothetical protein
METAKYLMVLMIATLLATGPIHANESSSPRISETYRASCLVKVTCDPVILPLSIETFDYLLQSSGVGGKAAREALEVSPDQVQDLFTIEYVNELTSKASPKSSMGRSSGLEGGMEEYEYAMMMEMEEMEGQYSVEMGRSRPTSSTRSSRGRSTSGRTGGRRSTGRTIDATSNFQVDEQTYLFSLIVVLPEEVKPAAEEFMDALLQNLRNALMGAFDEHMHKIKNQAKLADEEAARAEHELSMQQERLRVISGSRILNRDKILSDISDLRNDIQKIEMEQASDQVVVDQTTNQIAEIQAKMQKEIDKDTVTGQLKELLALQQQNFQNVEKLYQSGRASTNDLADAQERLARSRIDLAQRREQLSKSAGGNLINSLNSTLANYSLNTTQNKIKLEILIRQLAEAEELLSKADDYELLSLKAEIAKQNLQETILWCDRMSRQNRIIQPPAVSVIGGD